MMPGRELLVADHGPNRRGAARLPHGSNVLALVVVANFVAVNHQRVLPIRVHAGVEFEQEKERGFLHVIQEALIEDVLAHHLDFDRHQGGVVVFVYLGHRPGFAVLMYYLGLELVGIFVGFISNDLGGHWPKDPVKKLGVLEAVWSAREDRCSGHAACFAPVGLRIIEGGRNKVERFPLNPPREFSEKRRNLVGHGSYRSATENRQQASATLQPWPKE